MGAQIARSQCSLHVAAGMGVEATWSSAVEVGSSKKSLSLP